MDDLFETLAKATKPIEYDELLCAVCGSNENKIMSKIITSYDYPPIPIRDYDWSAIRKDYEPGDLIGTGRTEQDAIDDLVRQENEA